MVNKRELFEIKAKALAKINNDFLKDGDFIKLKQREAALNTNLKKLLKNNRLKIDLEDFLFEDWSMI